jgi:hypothetical protein
MRARSQTVLRDVLKTDEGAIEHVVARYQRVAPAITRFARTLSGNERLRVRLGAEAASGPDEVVCDPRLFQAAYARDAPVTPDETALASALHEVVHLVSTNFEERRPVPTHWPVEGERRDDPVDLMAALTHSGGPVAEALFFTLEDARQELQGMKLYPGARSVLADLYRAAYPDAVRQSGALSQFALGCFLLTGDYAERDRLERRLDARAALALADASGVVDRARECADPWDVAGMALELLAIARANGLLTNVEETDTESRRQAKEAHDAETATDSVDRLRLASPIVRDAESYSNTKRAAEARAGLSDRLGTSEIGADASTDQILRVSEAPTVYLPTGQAGKLIVCPAPAAFARFAPRGREALTTAARRWAVLQHRVSGELFPLFAANQRRGLRSGYDQGDVSPHAALFIGAGLYTRMYERRSARTRRTYAVSLLVDASASMLQPRQTTTGRAAGWGMSAALLGAWSLARLADELQIDFEVALFNRAFAARPDDNQWSYSRTRSTSIAGLKRTQGGAAERLTSTVNHYLVKPFDRRWREAEDLLAGMFWTATEPTGAATEARRDPRGSPPIAMFEKASNVDEFNLTLAAERMARLGAQVRVLVVLADGMTRGSVSGLATTVRAIERSGTTVLGIGIGDDTVSQTYDRYQVVERPEELTRAMVEGVRSSLRRSLSLWGMDTWWARPARPTVHTPPTVHRRNASA